MTDPQPYRQHAQAWPEKDMTVWDRNRETIRRLFLLENRTLAQVKHVLESDRGFPEFRLIDYEVTLREYFGFRKNLNKQDWLAIDYHRESRLKKGKTSNVYLQGRMMEKPRVDRAIRRLKNNHRLPYRGRKETDATHPLPEGVTIRTPSPILPSKAGSPSMSTTNTIDVLPMWYSGYSAHRPAVAVSELAMSIDMKERYLHTQISVAEMRLHLPFNNFAETIKLNVNTGSSPSPSLSPTYTDVYHASLGPTQLPKQTDSLSTNQVLSSTKQSSTARHMMSKARQQDHLTARNIPFVGGKFEFEQLMRVFFVLSNKQKILQKEAREIIQWIESADSEVIESLFTLPLQTVAAAWEQLIDLSLVLTRPDAFSKLLQAGLVVQKGEWLKMRAGKILGIAIWLGLKEWFQELLRMGLSPMETADEETYFEFLDDALPFVIYSHPSPETPLQVAILRADADAIIAIFQLGVRPSEADSKFICETLSQELSMNSEDRERHAAQLVCLQLLLEAGAPVDFERQRGFMRFLNEKLPVEQLGWFRTIPSWFPDELWHNSVGKDHLQRAFDLVAHRSERMKTSITVPGLCEAASRSCSELLRYLNSRAEPFGMDRNALLEVALSQAVSRGDLSTSKTFLQIGVNPDVPEIYAQFSQRSRPDHFSVFVKSVEHLDLAETYLPTYQASRIFHLDLLKALFEAGADPNKANLVDALLRDGQGTWIESYTSKYPDEEITPGIKEDALALALEKVDRTYDFLLGEGYDIQVQGHTAMANVIRRWGKLSRWESDESKVACWQLAWLHSKGIEWDVEFRGMNLIHLAVKYGRDLDLIRFLYARGVVIHSLPCHENTTMLYDAVGSSCSLEIIDFLLYHGANINDQSHGGRSILYPVLWRSRHEVSKTCGPLCKRLIELGAVIMPQQKTRLHPMTTSKLLAEMINLPEIEDAFIIRMLESAGSIPICYDPNYTMKEYFVGPLHTAISTGRLQLAKELLRRGGATHDASLIFAAAWPPVTKMCLSCPGGTAAKEFMDYLSTYGADINSTGPDGLNALHVAAVEGSLNVASMLLERRANPNAPITRVWFLPSEQQIADWKAAGDDLAILGMSVYCRFPKADSDPDERIAYDTEGRPKYSKTHHGPVQEPRALDLAAFNGRLDMVQLLINAGGISGRAEDTPYDGAIDSASENRHHTIVRLLEEEAADRAVSSGRWPKMNNQDPHAMLSFDSHHSAF